MTDDNNNKLYDLWIENKLPPEQWPRIGGSTDMGWQQKGSGRLRNSKSGHALFIGPMTRKVVAKAMCSKACAQCKKWCVSHPATEKPPPHKCFINHTGTSGAMEPIAVLHMCKWLHEQHVMLDWMVCDDDSSIKAKLKWSNQDHMKNNNTTEVPKIVNSNGNTVDGPNYGGIPGHMPEPTFKADPNHRHKILTNELYDLALKNKTSPEERQKKIDKRRAKAAEQAKKTGKEAPIIKDDNRDYNWNLTMTKMDVRRISKNFGFMMRTLKNKTSDVEMLEVADAVLEHHFDNHEHCGAFCRRKVEVIKDERKFYRDKKKDAVLYERLKKMLARFITLDALREVAHSLDTCANESFNNMTAWVAPKNKVYAGSNSLSNRMSMAIGIKTLGMQACYVGLHTKLGIVLTADVLHYLAVKSNVRTRRIDKTKSIEYKKKRKADECRRLKEETEEAKRARARREGPVYKTGIGMTGGYDAEDDEEATKDANVVLDLTKTCTRCKEPGHLRPSNKMCKCYVPRKNKSKSKEPSTKEQEPIDEEQAMAEEMDNLDILPLQDASSADTAFFSAASYGGDSDTNAGVVDRGFLQHKCGRWCFS